MTDNTSDNNRLVLASSSQARRNVLAKLQLPFETFSPDVDESHQAGEPPLKLVERLSIAKASAASHHFPDHLIIGSDQVAVVENQILGKPKNKDHAISQLELMSNKEVVLLTGLVLLNTRSGILQSDTVPYRVVFRKLSRQLIESYVDKDQPYDCGGSLRSEGLGILLLKEFDGNDPNALLGLPLIRLIDMLIKENVQLI